MIEDSFKVYIAGPITGIECGNRAGFYTMEERLDSLGIDSYNPRREDVPEFCTEYDIQRVMMKISIHHMLHECDTLVMLKGWQDSGGAKIEYMLANYLGYPVYDCEFNRLN